MTHTEDDDPNGDLDDFLRQMHDPTRGWVGFCLIVAGIIMLPFICALTILTGIDP